MSVNAAVLMKGLFFEVPLRSGTQIVGNRHLQVHGQLQVGLGVLELGLQVLARFKAW